MHRQVFNTTYRIFPYVVWTKQLSTYNIWTSYLYFVWKKSFFHTTYGQLVHMLYGQKQISIQHMYKLSICCMDMKFSSIKHMDKLALCFMDRNFLYIQQIEKLSICCMEDYINTVIFFELTK